MRPHFSKLQRARFLMDRSLRLRRAWSAGHQVRVCLLPPLAREKEQREEGQNQTDPWFFSEIRTWRIGKNDLFCWLWEHTLARFKKRKLQVVLYETSMEIFIGGRAEKNWTEEEEDRGGQEGRSKAGAWIGLGDQGTFNNGEVWHSVQKLFSPQNEGLEPSKRTSSSTKVIANAVKINPSNQERLKSSQVREDGAMLLGSQGTSTKPST